VTLMKQWMLVLLAVPLLFFAFRSQSNADESLSPQELISILKAGKKVQLIDVRTPEEYASGHLAGSRLIPLSELSDRALEIDKKIPVIFYCRSGNRSGHALELIADQGFLNPKHLVGGILAWNRAGFPTVQ
jgi:rhodanese-related sulfurtransferase